MTAAIDWREVARKSSSLSDDKLVEITRLIERMPEEGTRRELLAQMRPRLVRLRPPRRLTPQRLLFQPIEDLFDPLDQYRRKVGQVSRQAVGPCWELVQRRVSPTILKNIRTRLERPDPLSPEQATALGAPLWAAAAEALEDELGTAAKGRSGGRLAAELRDMSGQLSEMAQLFVIACEIEETKSNLPKRPIEYLAEADIEYMVGMINRVFNKSRQATKRFLFVQMARMERPGYLIDILRDERWARQLASSSQMMTDVEQDVFKDVLVEAGSLRDISGGFDDPVHAAAYAETLVDRLASMEKALGPARDDRAQKEIYAARRNIGEFIVGKVMAKADANLVRFIDSGTALAPDAGANDAQAAVEPQRTAEEWAHSLRRCASMSRHIGVRGQVEEKLDRLCGHIEQHTRLADQAGKGSPAQVYSSVRLIEILAGPGKAEELLREALNLDRAFDQPDEEFD